MSYTINIPGTEELDSGERPKATLYLFGSVCGHRWIGAIEGSFACPVCGCYSGDHHLTETLELPVQLDDWCDVFRAIADKVDAFRCAEREAREDWLESRVGELEAELAKRTGNGR